MPAEGFSFGHFGQHLALVYQDIFAAPLPAHLQGLVDQIDVSSTETSIDDVPEAG